MNSNNLIQIAGMFIIPLLVVLIPVYLGQRYGIYRSKVSSDLPHLPVGTVVGAAFGLLAFMLAFTFQIAAGRYEKRKELLLEEVTNIRTTHLRAGLLQEPFHTGTTKLLDEYVDLRVDLANNLINVDAAMKRSQQILDSLWDFCVTLSEQDRSSEIYALYTTSVNDLVEDYNMRITMTFEYRIPPIILWILFIIAFFSMLIVGYQFGISGKGSLRINLLLAIIFAVVMLLILALDRPESGLARIDQKPMITLQKQLQEMHLKGTQ